jgi:hypothetical protein
MRTLALWLIAACALAHTVAIYETEKGGTAIWVGNFGYAFEDDTQ